MSILRFGNNWLAWGGKLISMPDTLYTYIVNAFSNGWDRNRAIDVTGGANNNALMGGYLLAASNTTITITDGASNYIRTTDTLVALTSGGLVGTISSNSVISFSLSQKYGAFEVYRAGARIGRYCLTERTGLWLINQYTGAGSLPNGLLGGTTTTVWQRSNAFYSETNERGYSVSCTGWVTNTGAAITVNTLIPADLVNTTKCLAWVGGVQQDLQFIGMAKNSVSVVPYAHYFNADRNYRLPPWGGTVTTHYMRVYCRIDSTSNTQFMYGGGFDQSYTHSRCIYKTSTTALTVSYFQKSASVDISIFTGVPLIVEAGYDNGLVWIRATEAMTGRNVYGSTQYAVGSISIASAGFTRIGGIETAGFYMIGVVSYAEELANGIYTYRVLLSEHGAVAYNLVTKSSTAISGISTNLLQNVDLVYNAYNQTGFELWTNGIDYRVYPLASDGTRFITPAGYTIVETVTAGNMPSVADSRFTAFKYALANSYSVRNSVPEAYNADAQATPKLLTYAELSALSSNIKVTKTEVNGKITNITIRQ